MKIVKTPIDGVLVVEGERFTDHRGCFSRFFCKHELSSILGKRNIVQINYSHTQQLGSIRGMHFQFPPSAEMKLIRCLKGAAFDVAVDLRKSSKTFLQWYALLLTPETNNMLIIPEGCAHGFQTIKKDTELLYLHTSFYEPKNEGGIRFNDPVLNIKWPVECTDISEKDRKHLLIGEHYAGIVL
ncbi:MAG: dTDP-4-dehydrorhamnose 3,5-epimerase family protein [Bacteroidota bacterium]